MPHEQLYFHSFIYLILLIWFLAAGMFYAFRLVRRGKRGAALIIIFAAVITDLIIFRIQALPGVIAPRINIKFNERFEPFSFPGNRGERPFLDDRFRHFVPALMRSFNALDADSLARFSLSFVRRANVARMLDQIKDGDFPLEPEIIRHNVTELAGLGRDQFGAWNDAQKEAYLNFMELVLQEMTFHDEFYSVFAEPAVFLPALKKDIYEGYRALDTHTAWQSLNEAADIFGRLLRLELTMNPEIFPQFIKGQGVDPDSMIIKRIKAHYYIYRDVKALDYFLGLYVRYRLRNVNTFVRFKDFDRLAQIYEDTLPRVDTGPITRKIKSDMALSGPLVAFFPRAEFIDKEKYFSDLASGKIRPDALYLHARPVAENKDEGTDKASNFSYTVLQYNPNRLSLSAHADNPGYLYFSDGYDIYWKAKVNGKRARVYQANGAFKAVNIPAGASRVEFVYDPVYFRVSLWLYYLVSIGCVVFLLSEGRKRCITR